MNTLILASASAARARLLREAGVTFGVRPCDGALEDRQKAALIAQGTKSEDIATALAAFKALQVSELCPQALILGCDQVLVCEDRMIGKAVDPAEARARLQQLRGKAHTLITACALVLRGKLLWQHEDRAMLWMRNFSDAFLDNYLKRESSTALGCVGCYQLEGRGVQLFERIKGDYFSVLGLPLLAVLAALREHGIVAE
jgi:nucleoside triphosphate pyrophosphatase